MHVALAAAQPSLNIEVTSCHNLSNTRAYGDRDVRNGVGVAGHRTGVELELHAGLGLYIGGGEVREEREVSMTDARTREST